MAELTHEIADQLQAACQDGSEEAAGTFQRALDGEISLVVGDHESLPTDGIPEEWNDAGLAIAFRIGESGGGVLLLPASSGLVPDWCAEPDETGKSRLATLAQELACSLFPEEFEAEESAAGYVPELAAAFHQCAPADDLSSLRMTVSSGEKSGTLWLVWPLKDPLAALEVPTDGEPDDEATSQDARNNGGESVPSTEDVTPTETPAATERAISYSDLDDGIRQLPSYARSLLKVTVPVTVMLASSRQSVDQILDLSPGSIIQFEKSCDDNLSLKIGEQTIAKGEAVKVGDKFGLWITSMKMPNERFWTITGKHSGGRVK